MPKTLSPKLVTGVLAIAVSVAGAGIHFAAGPLGKTSEARKAHLPLTGKLMLAGAATINGQKALAGTTVLNESRIAIANTAGNAATIYLNKLGRLELQPGTELLLRFSDGFIGGELLTGQAFILNNAGVKVALNTPYGVAQTNGQDPAATVATTQLEKVPTPQEMLAAAEKIQNESQQATQAADNQLKAARQQKDVVKVNCVNDKLAQLKALQSTAESGAKALKTAVTENDKDTIQNEWTKLGLVQQKVSQLQAEASQCSGQNLEPPNDTAQVTSPEAPADPPVDPPVDPPAPSASPGPLNAGETAALAAGVAGAATSAAVAAKQSFSSNR